MSAMMEGALCAVALNVAMLIAVYLHHRYRVGQDNRAWQERIAPWVADMEAIQSDWHTIADDMSTAWDTLTPAERLAANRHAIEDEIRKGIPGGPLSDPGAFR